MGLEKFPRVKLDLWPTPLHKIESYGKLLGHRNLYIKRDDISLIGLGGNKIRKLEFWLGEALEKNCDVIVVAGGEQSNLVRLTAAACAKLQLECIAIHNANEPKFYQGNVLLNYYFGAKSIFLGVVTEEERGRETRKIVEKLRATGHRPYVINDEMIGNLGYVQCALELYDQVQKQDIDIKHIVIVGAMGITASGFIFGNALMGNPFEIHVISVEYPTEKLKCILAKKLKNLGMLFGNRHEKQELDSLPVYLYDEWMGEGWGVPTDESMLTIMEMAHSEGIILDHVYNAKTATGLKGLIEKGVIPIDQGACIIHTGGAPAFFGHAQLFQPNKVN